VRLQSFLIMFFMFTAISCSGSTYNNKTISYSPEDKIFISKYQNSGARYKLGKPYQIAGTTYNPRHEPSYSQVGMASWYGPNVGEFTANGERFDPYMITAAHPTLPLPSIVKVTNLNNGKEIIVRVNDRGPFSGKRIIDVSKGAAIELGMIRSGVARVKVELQQEATLQYLQSASTKPPLSYPIVSKTAPAPIRSYPIVSNDAPAPIRSYPIVSN
jgi:rare lipoprotein A (peptidoglycan hydrolase)